MVESKIVLPPSRQRVGGRGPPKLFGAPDFFTRVDAITVRTGNCDKNGL